MTRLALLRHGHTEWNRAGRIQGRSDIMLDAEARDELSAQRLPAPWDEAMLWSSPLERALDTAELVSGGQRPKAAPELIEMAWGDWEGQKGADLLADPGTHYSDIENWGWDFEPPGGETPLEMAARVRAWMEAALDPEAAAHVVVGHGGPLRVIAGQLLGLAPDRWLSLDFACGQATRLDIHAWGVALKWFNR